MHDGPILPTPRTLCTKGYGLRAIWTVWAQTWGRHRGLAVGVARASFRPTMRPLPLFLVLLACAACAPPDPPPMLDLETEEPTTYYLTHDRGRTLHFSIPVRNDTDSTASLYFFVYAADDVANPPARQAYPPMAQQSMGKARTFSVGRPDLGVFRELAAGDTTTIRGLLPLPSEWSDRRAIVTDGFRDLRLYAYTLAGKQVYAQSWPLRRIKGEILTEGEAGSTFR